MRTWFKKENGLKSMRRWFKAHATERRRKRKRRGKERGNGVELDTRTYPS